MQPPRVFASSTDAQTLGRLTMNDNPLSRLCPGILVLSSGTTIYEISRGTIHIVSLIATIGSVSLFVLYRRQSPHAASFLFWMTVPIYPLYFGFEALGLFGQRPAPLTYVVAATIWVGWTIFGWRLRRKYAAYIEASSASVRAGSGAV